MSARREGLILAIDQGTTASKAEIFDPAGRLLGSGRAPLRTRFAAGGIAEQDPAQILSSQRLAIRRALDAAKHPSIGVAGIASQRSTFVIWDRHTGRPVGPAPTWQSTMASDDCLKMRDDGPGVQRRTGLPLSPHYSASKIGRVLGAARGLRRRAERGDLLFGNVATWLLWNLTGGEIHATDPTHAARTLLFNIEALDWDPWLLERFNVPRAMLPQVRPSLGDFGEIRIDGSTVPVSASMGDQQAALAGAIGLTGQRAEGSALVNYGTGAFVLLPTGNIPRRCEGLLTSLAWTSATDRRYLLEGTINSAGAALDWLRKDLGAPADMKKIDRMCRDAGGRTLLLPAFWGLGSAYSSPGDTNLPSITVNLGPYGTLPDLTRSAVEATAHMVAVIIERVSGGGSGPRRLVATGNLTALPYLLEFQAALLPRIALSVAPDPEASLAGIALAAAPRWKPEPATGRGKPSRSAPRISPPIGLKRTAIHRHREWRRLIALARIWKQVAEAYP